MFGPRGLGWALVILTSLLSYTEAKCQLEPPIKDGLPQIGLIFVPGAQISGENYIPLMRQIQENTPASLWIGATAGWLGDMPNPIEIGGQLDSCLKDAEAEGLLTDTVFFAGHSLGGIVLENYISGHSDNVQGIILLGTWLPNLVRDGNEFPVPVLTAIGELDGGGISYLRREWQETAELPTEKQLYTKTILVPQVNHGQVASGEMPESVVDNDIDGELTEEEAHRNYATRVGDWILFNSESIISESEVEAARARFLEYEDETSTFLAPFLMAMEMEQMDGSVPFVATAQEALMRGAINEMPPVKDLIIESNPVFQAYMPEIIKDGEGISEIHTFSHLKYDLDVLDFNNHLSASTVKAKMKSADAILDAMGSSGSVDYLECAVLNQMAMDQALAMASEVALKRMEEKGRSLTMGPDKESVWGGLAWELSALEWDEVAEGEVVLTSSRLVSGVDFPLYPGLQYCDILSPYRALEWIYIESLRHVMHL